MPNEQELKKKIRNLEALEPEPGSDEYALLERYRRELASLASSTPTAAAPAADDVDFAIGESEWEAAKSKFARKGLHLAEFGVPDWATAGKSIKLPFTIISGPDAGIESAIYCGIDGKAIGVLKRYIQNLGIQPTFPITLSKLRSWIPGRKAMVLWAEQMDRRPPEEGGKGTIYTKAVDILPVGTPEPEELV